MSSSAPKIPKGFAARINEIEGTSIELPAVPPWVRVETRDGVSMLTVEQVRRFESDFFDGWLECARPNQAGQLELMIPVNTKVWKRAVTCMETKSYRAPPSWAGDKALSGLLYAQLDYFGPRPLTAAIGRAEAAAREKPKIRFRSPPVTKIDLDRITWHEIMDHARQLRKDTSEPSVEAVNRLWELADILHHLAQSKRFQCFPDLQATLQTCANESLVMASNMQKRLADADDDDCVAAGFYEPS